MPGRIAEVTARFTLDAMPGKQMSIDAEMNSGVITEAEALTQKSKRFKKTQTFMDQWTERVNLFVETRLLVSFITVVNIIGGILDRVFPKGHDYYLDR